MHRRITADTAKPLLTHAVPSLSPQLSWCPYGVYEVRGTKNSSENSINFMSPDLELRMQFDGSLRKHDQRSKPLGHLVLRVVKVRTCAPVRKFVPQTRVDRLHNPHSLVWALSLRYSRIFTDNEGIDIGL